MHACQSARSLTTANSMLTQRVVLCLCVLQSIMNGFQHEQPDYWLTFGRWRAPVAASATSLMCNTCQCLQSLLDKHVT